jgi:hypothetical protein
MNVQNGWQAHRIFDALMDPDVRCREAVTGVLGVPAVRCTVEPRHDRLVAAIGHVVYEATIAAIEIERLQDAEVALIFDDTARVARGPIEVDDAGIQAMCRIEFAEHRAVQPLMGPHGTEFRAAEHGSFPLGYLDPLHAADAHDVLPRELVIDGQPSNPPDCRKSSSSLLAEAARYALRSRIH